MVYRVMDIGFEDVVAGTYDLAIFASGYERRCTSIPRRLRREQIRRPLVLGFEELGHDEERVQHDRYYAESWNCQPKAIGSRDDDPIYESLLSAAGSDDTLHVIVDYSSMSRLWYASILNWARYQVQHHRTIIDFVYAVGAHQQDVPPMVIQDIVAIPGCEGGAVHLSNSVAAVGLGFDGYATLCVYDRLEPTRCYAFLAAPAAFPDYPGRARELNDELIKKHAAKTLELPLYSVEQTFVYLAELLGPHRADASITLVPMGPKPHILASILLSMRFPEIACLHVSGRRSRPDRVDTTGEVVATRVEFHRADTSATEPSTPA